jgi:hypothetical protein
VAGISGTTELKKFQQLQIKSNCRKILMMELFGNFIFERAAGKSTDVIYKTYWRQKSAT